MTVTYGAHDVDVTSVDRNATESCAGTPLHVVHGTVGGRKVHLYASDATLADLGLTTYPSTSVD